MKKVFVSNVTEYTDPGVEPGGRLGDQVSLARWWSFISPVVHRLRQHK